ncbi:LysR family transcriptional regulator [Isoptericola sp. NPDC060282]|uniref:LysR family transcriptional regulator n=1 Tax=Isoptericola sp. NPDC060282 TaxID=3347093 RepID=UPI0036686C64
MDVRHLALLRELADRGSVTAVAQATHRTPSAVSQQLRTTQRELRTPLVEPSGRGLRLTEAGRLLAEGGASVAAAVAQVQARWDEFQGEPSGTVSVGGGGGGAPRRGGGGFKKKNAPPTPKKRW